MLFYIIHVLLSCSVHLYCHWHCSLAKNGASRVTSIKDVDFGDIMGVFSLNISFNSQYIAAGCGNGAIQVDKQYMSVYIWSVIKHIGYNDPPLNIVFKWRWGVG